MNFEETTTLDQFLKSAWEDHAERPAEVAARFQKGLKLLERNDQVPLIAQLITHVMGEHLGQWQTGIDYLRQLQRLDFFDPTSESQSAIHRSIACL